MAHYDVYGLGNALVDYEYKIDGAWLQNAGLSKGHMTLVSAAEQQRLINTIEEEPVTCASGGSGANSVIALAQFGGRGYYSCKVGNDIDGEFYCADMSEAGIDTNLAAGSLPNGQTGTCLVLISEDGERTMCSALGITSLLSENELDEEALVDSKYLYLEGYVVASDSARRAAIRAHEMAAAANVKTALSLSDASMVNVFKDGLEQMIGSGVDLLFANLEEACLFCQCNNVEDAIKHLKTKARNVVITDGAKGSLVFDGQNAYKIPAVATKCIDTLGAGDMYAGAYLYGITHRMSPQKAGEFAALAAAKIVSVYGPRLDGKTAKALLKSFV